MRITFVLPFVNLTGGIRVLLGYANWLHDHQHEVRVVYPLWPYRFHFTRREQLGEGRREWRRKPGVPWMDLRAPLRRVPLIANAFVPPGDLVIATAWPTAFDVARLAPSRGRPVQTVFHHEAGTGPEARIRATYRLPFYRITFARSVQGQLEREFDCRVDDLVPAGVDRATFFPDGTREERSVLMLYHDHPRKGAGDGLEALRRLRERRPEVRIRLCGTVRPRDLPPWIPFELAPSDADLRRLYSTAAVLLYPSRVEGFGLPPLEAMACGCAVVTTPVGAVPEFARDGDNAFVVAPQDSSAMADRLDALLGDVSLRDRFGRRGMATAREYSMARAAPLFAAALERAVGRA